MFPHFRAGVFCVLLAFLSNGCQSRGYNPASQAASTPDGVVQGACLGIQGNGTNFSSHLGTLIALYENNIDPEVIIGGSSGSIVGSIGRALMNNKSIRDPKNAVQYPVMNKDSGTPLRDEFGKMSWIDLSYTQKAALVLAAAEDVMNGFLFLPGIDEVTSFEYVTYLLNFKDSLVKGNQLPAEAINSKILNIEPTVGTAVLITAFFQHFDFGSILKSTHDSLQEAPSRYLEEFQSRKVLVGNAFQRYARADVWSLAQVIDLYTDPTVVLTPFKFTPKAIRESRQERRLDFNKVKVLFGEDPYYVDEETAAASAEGQSLMMSNVVTGPLWWLFHAGLATVNESIVKPAITAKTFGALFPGLKDQAYGNKVNRAVNGEFILPDPELIMRAYHGFVPDPADLSGATEIFVRVPKGMIVHSTFQVGNVSVLDKVKWEVWKKFEEKKGLEKIHQFKKIPYKQYHISSNPGFNHLYQGYITDDEGENAELFKSMLARRDSAWRNSQSGENWVSNTDQLDLSQAAYLLYRLDDLRVANSKIKASPVKDFGDNLPIDTGHPRNSTELSSGGFESYMDPRNVLLFGQEVAYSDVSKRGAKDGSGQLTAITNRGLNFAIRASAAEPGAFRRYPIRFTARDQRYNQVDGVSAIDLSNFQPLSTVDAETRERFADVGVIPFGGWGENVPLSSVAHLPACQKAQFFVASGKTGPGNDFQAGALLAAINGQYVKGSFPTDAQMKEAGRHFQRLNASVEFSRRLPGKAWILNDMNFDKPCSVDGQSACSQKEVNQINDAIVPLPWGESRLPMAVFGYQRTMASLVAAEGSAADRVKANVGRFNAFGQNVYEDQIIDLDKWKSDNTVETVKTYLDNVRLGKPVK